MRAMQNRRLWIGCFFGLTLLIGPASRWAQAIDASPHPVDVLQPDGTKVKLYIRGTEEFNWEEDEAGFTVVRKGAAYYYAVRDASDRLSATSLLCGKVNPAEAGLTEGVLPSAAEIDKIRAMALPLPDPEEDAGIPPMGRATPIGAVKNVVILMKFSDHADSGRTVPSQSDFDTIFNAVGGDATLAPSGSVRDVYLENSYGALKLNSTVFAWVTLPHSEEHYADGNSGLTVKIRDAIHDALELADPLIDFSQFDEDGNDLVDAIAFVHSGYGAEWGGTDADGAHYKDRIWSHRWGIPTWTSDEGVKVRDYHINPGLWSTSGEDPGHIGVICHETGHFFGLPDLYDTSGAGSGIGSWGMMANSWGFGGKQLYPPHFSAWSKIFLEWITPTVISSPGVYSVPLAEKPGAEIYKISAGYPSGEYLLIENRQAVGFDEKIPAGTAGKGGLAIWHIDEDKPGNNDPGWPGQAGWPGNNKHYKVALLQADGNYDLEKRNNRGDAGDVYRQGFIDQLDSTTTPNTKGYQGGAVVDPGHIISQITPTAATMQFRFGDGEDPPDGKEDCCAVAASAQFPWSPPKAVSSNSNIAQATIKLDQEMEVHIAANTSARTAASGLLVRTGFYNQSATNTMWTNSYRRIHFNHANRAVDFGSSFAIRLKPGTHTIYWKLWVNGGEVQFDSGCMTIEAFAIPKSPTSAAATSLAPAAESTAESTAGSPEQTTASKDDEGNDVTSVTSEASDTTTAGGN
ncbi:MAG: M6 family metalloprotease domain-containing protein [Planctomycetes bacterium]|nr:M6 family metalloprotease domain-containing protein [Planctomycetota bacterium]